MADTAPEIQAFAADIREILADDSATLSLRQTDEPGHEPSIALLVNDVPVFHYSRAELIDALYQAGCDALADLDRAGLPLAVGADTSTGGRP